MTTAGSTDLLLECHEIRAGVVSCRLTHLRGQCGSTAFHIVSLAKRVASTNVRASRLPLSRQDMPASRSTWRPVSRGTPLLQMLLPHSHADVLGRGLHTTRIAVLATRIAGLAVRRHIASVCLWREACRGHHCVRNVVHLVLHAESVPDPLLPTATGS